MSLSMRIGCRRFSSSQYDGSVADTLEDIPHDQECSPYYEIYTAVTGDSHCNLRTTEMKGIGMTVPSLFMYRQGT